MGFFSDLFVPANVKHYRKLAAAAGDLRTHAFNQMGIELNLLASSTEACRGFYLKIVAPDQEDLRRRMLFALADSDQFLERIKGAFEARKIEHQRHLRAAKEAPATDAKALSKLVDFENETAGLMKETVSAVAPHLSEIGTVKAEAITYLKANGLL